MKTVSLAALVAVVLVAGLFAADTARFKHVVSVYADDKIGGLHLPEGVACTDTGQLVIGDTGNDRLLRFAFQDKALTGGSEIKVPELSSPTRVKLNSKGDIYALDGKLHRIVHLGPEGEFRNMLTFDGAPPPTTIVPKSFTIDSADRIYVLDAFSARVLILDAEGRFQKALGLPDDAGFVSDLAVDAQGTVLVIDAVRRRLLAAGGDASAFTPLGDSKTRALVAMPTSLFASRGLIFVAEGSGGSIATFGQDGSFLGRQLTMGWREGSLDHPSQMCINEKDEVFIADRDNSRIQVFTLSR